MTETGKPLKFRLPLTDDFTSYVKLEHGVETDRYLEVKGENGAKYCEVEAINFGLFTASPTWPALTAGEGYTLDFVAETLKAETGYEVSSTNGDTASALTNDKAEPGSTYYVRKAADASHAASAWAEIKAPARPEKPAATIVSTTAGSITVSAVSGAEYSLDGTDWQDSNVFAQLDAASVYTVHVRIKAVEDTSFASEEQTIQKVYTNAAAPSAGDGYTIKYAAEEVIVEEGYEISRSNDPFSAKKLTDGSLTIEPDTTYYIRKAAVTGGASVSEAVAFTTPARPAAVTGVTAQQETIVKKDDAYLRGVTENME